MADRKHLFGSSEKSDFILNMTDAGTKKFCAVYCIIAMLIVEAAAIPYYLTKNVVDYYDTMGDIQMPHYVSDKVIYWAAVLMFGIGLLGFCVLLIGRMKKQISLNDNRALLWLGAVIAMSFVSALCANEIGNAMTGYLDRAEGMLTLLGYYGFFAAAFTVVSGDWRKRVCAVIIVIGVVNAVLGIMQIIPGIRGSLPNWFNKLNVTFTQVYDVPAANGLAMTPHALAAILTVSFAISAVVTVFSHSMIYKLFCAAACMLMTVAGIYTRTITALIGIGSAAIFVIVIAAIYAIKHPKAPSDAEKPEGVEIITSAKNVLISLVCMLAIVGGTGAVLAFTGEVDIYDEEVIRTDSIRMLMLLQKDDDSVDQWVYPYLWDDGLYIAEQNALLGVGPDNWETISKAGGTIDRTYNEYIDIAMQRGFITLALYVVFLLITVKKALFAAVSFARDEENWVGAAVLCAVTAYLVQAFFNISSVTSSPFFFICAGLAWSFTARKKLSEKITGDKKAKNVD